jgi:hypothetical protein
MPRSIAHIPQNRWAWILKDRMEETHKHVRENVKGAMHRQKKYYDQNLSWQIFQPDDQVFVFLSEISLLELNSMALSFFILSFGKSSFATVSS